jgi:CheY-like chemotaxis protein
MKLFFKKSLPEKDAIINTDREKIFAILTNLVKNAIKYTHAGFIEFGYRLISNDNLPFVEFYVKDTGIGVPADRQEAIFERFIQADVVDKLARQGAGLGLAIAKAYVELLGGRIWIESEEGQGSVFRFTIPYNAVHIESQFLKNISGQDRDKNAIDNLKILIAEDDDISSMLLALEMEHFSREIIKVKTGAEAVNICSNCDDIDLVLMDIKMPEMSGYEAARKIRQLGNKVIIIAQTAFGLTGDREKAIEAGCNDYISKPIHHDVLMKLMQKYFG